MSIKRQQLTAEYAGKFITESSTELIVQDKNLSSIGGDLERFKSLRKLDLSFNFFTSLDHLGQFPKLTHLSAYCCTIDDIGRLEEVPRLVVLRLQQNKITEMPIALEQMKKLTELRLDRNNLTSIEHLQNCSSLQTLNLGNNRLKSVEGLVGLQNLLELRLGNNQIHSLRSLKGLPSVQELDVSYNQLTSLDGIQFLPTLQTLHAEHNKITTVQIGQTYSRSNQKLKNLGKDPNGAAKLEKNAKILAAKTNALGGSRSSSKLGSAAAKQRIVTASASGNNSVTSSNGVGSVGPDKDDIVLGHPSLTDIYLKHNEIYSLVGLNTLGSRIEILDVTYNKLSDMDDVVANIQYLTELTELYIANNPMKYSEKINDNDGDGNVFSRRDCGEEYTFDNPSSSIDTQTALCISTTTLANSPHPLGSDAAATPQYGHSSSDACGSIDPDDLSTMEPASVIYSGVASAPVAPASNSALVSAAEMERIQAQNYWKRVLTPLLNAAAVSSADDANADDTSTVSSRPSSVASSGLSGAKGGLAKLRCIDKYKIVVKEKEVVDAQPLSTPPNTAAANLSGEESKQSRSGKPPTGTSARGKASAKEELLNLLNKHQNPKDSKDKDKDKDQYSLSKGSVVVSVEYSHMNPLSLFKTWENSPGPSPVKSQNSNPSSLLDATTATHIEREVLLENKPNIIKEKRVYKHRQVNDDSDDAGDSKKKQKSDKKGGGQEDDDDDDDEDFADYQGGARAPTLFLRDMKSEKEMQAIENVIKTLIRHSKSKISEQVNSVIDIEQKVVREQEAYLKGVSDTLHPVVPSLLKTQRSKNKDKRHVESDDEEEDVEASTSSVKPPKPVFANTSQKPGIRSSEPQIVTSGHLSLPRPPVRSVLSVTRPTVTPIQKTVFVSTPIPTAATLAAVTASVSASASASASVASLEEASLSVNNSMDLNLDTAMNTIRNTGTGTAGTTTPMAMVDEDMLRPLSRGNIRDNPRPKSAARVKFSDVDDVALSPVVTAAPSSPPTSAEITSTSGTKSNTGSRPTSATSSNIMQKVKGNIGLDTRRKTPAVTHNFAAKPKHTNSAAAAAAAATNKQQQQHEQSNAPLLQVISIQPSVPPATTSTAPTTAVANVADVNLGDNNTASVGVRANILTERMYTAEGGLAKRTQSGSALLDAVIAEAEAEAAAAAEATAARIGGLAGDRLGSIDLGASGSYSPRLGTGRLGTGRLGTGLGTRRGSASNVLDDVATSRQTTASNLGVPGTRGSDIDYNRLMSASREGSLASRDGEGFVGFGFGPGSVSKGSSRGGSRQLNNFRVPTKAKESIQGKDYENLLHHQLKQGIHPKTSIGGDSDSENDEVEEDEHKVTEEMGEKKGKKPHTKSAMDEKTEEELLAVLNEYEGRLLESLDRDIEREELRSRGQSRLKSASGSREFAAGSSSTTGNVSNADGTDVITGLGSDDQVDQTEDDRQDDEQDDDVLNSLEIDAVVSYKEDEDDDEDDDYDEEE